jgi:CheY-like chemotaxis protein
MIGRVLRAEGWAINEAVNGKIGLQRLEADRPDVILLDLLMPEMDGFEFLAQCRSDPNHRHIPVIIVTAADLSAADRDRLTGAADHILRKAAYPREELLREIRQLVATYAEAMKLTGTGS